jgi:hypothetical protein
VIGGGLLRVEEDFCDWRRTSESGGGLLRVEEDF